MKKYLIAAIIIGLILYFLKGKGIGLKKNTGTLDQPATTTFSNTPPAAFTNAQPIEQPIVAIYDTVPTSTPTLLNPFLQTNFETTG